MVCYPADIVTGVPNPQLLMPRTHHQKGLHETNHLALNGSNSQHKPTTCVTQWRQHPTTKNFPNASATVWRQDNEFVHLLLNYLRPHSHKLFDEHKLNYFQSLLSVKEIEFRQTLKKTTKTTLCDTLVAFKYAKEELTEVWKSKFDQLRYDPATLPSHSTLSSLVTKK